MNKKFIAGLMSALMLAMPINAFAATVADNPAGDRVEELASGDDMNRNYGAIMVNRGLVKTNSQIGVIMDNYGLVNENKGTVRDNYGRIEVNELRVINNNLGGIIENNNGTVENNYGTVLNGSVKNQFYKVTVEGSNAKIRGLTEEDGYWWVQTLKDGQPFEQNFAISPEDRCCIDEVTATGADIEELPTGEYVLKNVMGDVVLHVTALEIGERIEAKPLTAMSSFLQKVYSSVDELEEAMEKKLKESFDAEDTATYEVCVEYSYDGEKTWERGGIPGETKVLLDYPKGTNGKDYEFFVVNVCEENTPDGVYKVGEIYTPAFKETDEGLEVVFDFLCTPAMIGWKKAATDESVSGKDAGNTSPKTGDSGATALVKETAKRV